MKNQVKKFSQFINESDEFEIQDDMAGSNKHYGNSEKWNTLRDFLDSEESSDPSVADAVDAMLDDAQCSPNEIKYLGAFENLTMPGSEHLIGGKNAGYPGAISISKIAGSTTTLYVMQGYEEDFLWMCNN